MPLGEPLAPHPPGSWPSHRLAFICSQGANSRQTTWGSAPTYDSARLLGTRSKSPDRPQSGPWARVPHPTAGQTVAAVYGMWPHQGQAGQPRRWPSGFRWEKGPMAGAHIVACRPRCSWGPAQLCFSPLPAPVGLLPPSPHHGRTLSWPPASRASLPRNPALLSWRSWEVKTLAAELHATR